MGGFNSSHWLVKVLVFLLALVSINYPALINGYPLLYSDSGTYIVAGFLNNYFPVDRPIYYSLFVRHASLWYSLWVVLLAQSLVLLYVLKLAMKYILQLQNPFVPACLVATVLSFTTGLAYNSSQIMADVFSPIMLLCIATLVAGHTITPGQRTWLAIILLFSISVHSSHLLIASCTGILLWIIRILNKRKPFFASRKRQHQTLIFYSIASWLIISLFNYWMGAGFKPSRTSNLFTVARCVETGAAKVYLDTHCEQNTYDLCRYKDSLPRTAVDFLWDFGNSPLYFNGCKDRGWGECWVEKDKQYGDLVKNIVLYPKSRDVLLKQCAKDSWIQLQHFDLGHLTPMAENSPVYGGIRDFFARDMKMYKDAYQYTEMQTYETSSKVQRWAVYISLLVIVAVGVWSARKKFGRAALAFAIAVVAGCIINTVICASFSGVVDRYLARMIWLVPLAALLMAWSAWQYYKSTKQDKE